MLGHLASDLSQGTEQAIQNFKDLRAETKRVQNNNQRLSDKTTYKDFIIKHQDIAFENARYPFEIVEQIIYDDIRFDAKSNKWWVDWDVYYHRLHSEHALEKEQLSNLRDFLDYKSYAERFYEVFYRYAAFNLFCNPEVFEKFKTSFLGNESPGEPFVNQVEIEHYLDDLEANIIEAFGMRELSFQFAKDNGFHAIDEETGVNLGDVKFYLTSGVTDGVNPASDPALNMNRVDMFYERTKYENYATRPVKYFYMGDMKRAINLLEKRIDMFMKTNQEVKQKIVKNLQQTKKLEKENPNLSVQELMSTHTESIYPENVQPEKDVLQSLNYNYHQGAYPQGMR